jgi:Carboxypeptidase regulatory-like domain
VLETGTVIVQGSVLDSGFALQGARVEVLSGIGAGKAATTDANGRYKLFGLLGSIQMRASLDGYVSQTVDATASASKSVNFALTPTTPPIDLGGNWDLTFDASPSCTTLPDVARQRTYTAAITQTGTSLRVTLSGANFAPDTSFYYAPGSVENQFRAHVVGNAIALTLNTFNYYGTHYDLAEIIADNTQLRIVGKGSGTITSSTVSGTLDGYLAVFTSGSPPSGVTCTAADHRFTFVRHSATSGRRR